MNKLGQILGEPFQYETKHAADGIFHFVFVGFVVAAACCQTVPDIPETAAGTPCLIGLVSVNEVLMRNQDMLLSSDWYKSNRLLSQKFPW